MIAENLMFRRQFILSPVPISKFDNWICNELAEGYCIYTHPELKVTRVKGENIDFVLMGYILDPENPDRSDEEIIGEIVNSELTIDEQICKFTPMAGRYACVTFVRGKHYIFNDPLGFRQVFYLADKDGKMWCASQPALIADQFGSKSDSTIENDFFKLKIFRNAKEYWYPGTVTIFKEIYHLLPNHYVDFDSKKQYRFWPNEILGPLSIDKCIEESSVLLEKLIYSVYKRFEILMAVTAGLDSRVLLSATKNISNKIQYFTHTHKKLNISGADISIPSVMLKDLGLYHTVIFHSEIIDQEFERIFRRNVTTARLEKGINAYALYTHFSESGKEKVVIHGNAGEITRRFFYLPFTAPVTGLTLGALTGMENSKIAVEQYDLWLRSARFASKYGIDILDLFYWEQRIANWAAMSYSEYDIAFENFSPFSCRRLLTTMLSVSPKYRKSPRYLLHYGIISKLWPEILNYEVNPAKNRSIAIRRQIKGTFIHSLYKSALFLKYSSLIRGSANKKV